MLTCDGNLRFKYFRLWRNNRLTGIRHNMAKLLNILFNNTFGRISRVTESTFIRTRSDGRMVITCRIFKRPHHGFTTTHDRGVSQFNRAPIFPWLKTFCLSFFRCKRLKLSLNSLYLPNFGFLPTTVPPQWTGKLHDRNFRLTRRCFSLFWEVSVHTFNSSLTICLISSFKGLDLNFEHSSTS